MQQLTDPAWNTLCDISRRYGVSTDASLTLLQALINGNGTMAQFYHPDLGGGGQWMQGGMTMVSDLFNHSLRAKVDGLCFELSSLLSQNPFVPLPPRGNFGGTFGGGSGNWWPAEFGMPNSSGGQNNIRYAYFSGPRRLAVEVNGRVTVYDTLDHQIGGVSQQQGNDSSLTFSSQYGTLRVNDLPMVAGDGMARNPLDSTSAGVSTNQGNFAQPYPPPQSNQQPQPYQPNVPQHTHSSSQQEADIFGKIERLAELKGKGIVSDEEFSAKKAELLSRL